MKQRDSIHERARLLAADALDEQLPPQDAARLAAHLAECDECREAADDFAAIRAELRALPMPTPPRDLWARTAAGLDQVDRSRTRSRSGSPASARAFSPSMFASAVAVAAVVVMAGASIVAQPFPTAKPATSQIAILPTTPAGTQIAGTSTLPSGSPVVVLANSDTVVYEVTKDGQILEKRQTCSTSGQDCTLDPTAVRVVGQSDVRNVNGAAVDSSTQKIAVWNDSGITVVPVKTPIPTATVAPKPTPTSTVSQLPTATPTSRANATASATPLTQPTSILQGYTPVGEPAFSSDAAWLGFAARPKDGSRGPDVFVWHAGDAVARQLTTSHRASFSGWLGATDQLLISEALLPDSPLIVDPTQAPSSSSPSASSRAGSPEVTPAASSSRTPKPTRTPTATQSSGSAVPTGTAAPEPSMPAGSTALVPTSYILDPVSCVAMVLGRPMLDPVIDASATRIVYRAAIVYLDASGGEVILSGDVYYDLLANIAVTTQTMCQVPQPAASSAPPSSTSSPSQVVSPSGSAASASPSVSRSATPTSSASPLPTSSATATPAPDASPSPAPAALPQRLPVADSGEVTGDWQAKWDPSGKHVAVWVGDAGASEGQLRIFAVDQSGISVSTNEQLLGTPALRSFVISDTAIVFTSSPTVGDGEMHKLPWPVEPPKPDPSPTPAPTQAPADASDRPGH